MSVGVRAANPNAHGSRPRFVPHGPNTADAPSGRVTPLRGLNYGDVAPRGPRAAPWAGILGPFGAMMDGDGWPLGGGVWMGACPFPGLRPGPASRAPSGLALTRVCPFVILLGFASLTPTYGLVPSRGEAQRSRVSSASHRATARFMASVNPCGDAPSGTGSRTR